MSHTHYAPMPAGITMGLRFVLFSLDTCEQCDCEVCAPNKVGTFESEARLISLGFQKRATVPGEMNHCEEIEMAVCESCEQKATADSD
jgi:hypothetical protein